MSKTDIKSQERRIEEARLHAKALTIKAEEAKLHAQILESEARDARVSLMRADAKAAKAAWAVWDEVRLREQKAIHDHAVAFDILLHMKRLSNAQEVEDERR